MSALSVDTTAAATIKTGPCALVSVQLCAGADAATCTVYDNTSATGDVIAKLGAGIGLSKSFTPAFPTECAKGIHVALTGTTPQIIVSYL